MALALRRVRKRKGFLMIASFTRTFLFLLLLATGAAADTLTEPDRLIDLPSPRGEAFLLESHALEAYFPISVVFETQKTQAYCGVASTVMVLNALHAPAPTTPEYKPYTVFTQDNVLDEKSDAIRPRELLAHRGMTLDQLAGILALHPVTVEVHHAAPGAVDEFRKLAADYLSRENHFVIVNYSRKALGQEPGGHISPLAAYDEKADRFLILDVARYKHPPVWVTTSDLFDAMNTPDSDNADKTRGYVLIAGQGSAANAPAQ